MANIISLIILLSCFIISNCSASNYHSNNISNIELNNFNTIFQNQKLYSGKGAINHSLGYSVSISGNRALIGALYSDDAAKESGAAYIFDYIDGQWTLSAKLIPGDSRENHRFGYSVSLDGDKALVSAFYNDHSNSSGSVYVFQHSDGEWSETAKLTTNDVSADKYLGNSVSILGNRALVGAYIHNSFEGAAYIFELVDGTWVKTSELTPDDTMLSVKFGISVSLSNDLALIGASGDNVYGNSSGAAYVFQYQNNEWERLQKLFPDEANGVEEFGHSVSLDGQRALIGSFGNVNQDGSAYIFDYNGKSWQQTIRLIADDAATNDRFGISVSLSGNQAIVGASGNRDAGSMTGSAYVFEYDKGAWSQEQKLLADIPESPDHFGFSVANANGRILVGSIGDDDFGWFSGSSYIFEKIDSNWSITSKLQSKNGTSNDYFGSSISLYGNKAIVGVEGDADNGAYSGSVYFYDLIDGRWILNKKVVLTDGMPFDNFGGSVSLFGNRALIGVSGDNENGENSGAVYVFEFFNGDWHETAKLMASGSEEYNSFGFSVSLYEDRALIAALNSSYSGRVFIFDYDNSWVQSPVLTGDYSFYSVSSVSLSGDRALIGASGTSFVFDLVNGNWEETYEIYPNDRETNDAFAIDVSLDGDRALFSAAGNDEFGNNAGAAYLFEFDNGNWVEEIKFRSSDIRYDDAFGTSVSLNGDMLLIGSPGDDDYGSSSGSAYLFKKIGTQWEEVSKVMASDNDDNDRFGSELVLFDEKALVGAPFDDTSFYESSPLNIDAGSVSFFNLKDNIYKSGFEVPKF
jgi:hypothetical protein